MARIETRDTALWIRSLKLLRENRKLLLGFLALPWKLIVCEDSDATLLKELEQRDATDDVMIRKRGLVQILDQDPSRVELPQRCLQILLINGPSGHSTQTSFEANLRRMTMLDQVRRSAPREILVLGTPAFEMPPDLGELWSTGFRSFLTIIADTPGAVSIASEWAQKRQAVATLVEAPPDEMIAEAVSKYELTYPEHRHVIRMKTIHGQLIKLDITELDEPERPLFDFYSLIEEKDLHPLNPSELPEEDFTSFFRDSTSSWRPYAADLPWVRSPEIVTGVLSYMKYLETDGAEENKLLYITSEPGAGGTTLARTLAYVCAREGYPVLIAKPLPFTPDPLPVSNFLNRIHDLVDKTPAERGSASTSDSVSVRRQYEVPWLVVFDTIHSQYRESELNQFRNAMEKMGRPVCLLVVAGTQLVQEFQNRRKTIRLADLNHVIDVEEARALGRHLNKFLKSYTGTRSEAQWDRFYQEHTIRYLEGTAAFWVALSFWIQGQFDLNDSIQDWVYKVFLSQPDIEIKQALLRIAAFATERLPLPERLLPTATQGWPISYRLAETRHSLAALGLTPLSSDGEKYWAIIHDILGRLLINGLFYDSTTRSNLGYGAAMDPNHLRFMLLSQISQDSAFSEKQYRTLGEDFATTIFKIDPDHGHAGFVNIWREVLRSLDSMPASLRNTSRLFRHHTAISKRRIAKLDEQQYGVTLLEKKELLLSAIRDLTYALRELPPTTGGESTLNLLNSLANAYFDLADLATQLGTEPKNIAEIQGLANEATKRAYQENPTNSFVIETYAKNLLRHARNHPESVLQDTVEVLGMIFSAQRSGDPAYRVSQLNHLAQQAFDLLLRQAPSGSFETDIRTPVDVLVQAWRILAFDDRLREGSLDDVAEERRQQALQILEHPLARGNVQAISLRYNLVTGGRPYAFDEHIELLDQINPKFTNTTPQLRLEYAILLFQNSRFFEGDKLFRDLRQLWRESEHLVEVPERLRWLRASNGGALRVVHAKVSEDYGTRTMAKVQEFGGIPAPLRPEEHGFRELRVGLSFACHVSFGHNGPFLRPLTAGARA